MRKLLIIAAVIVMAGIANAQSTLCRDVACECNSGITSGPGSCDKVASGGGACDSNSLCVDLMNDLANCGSLGHVCSTGSDCVAGVCESDDGGGIGGIQPSRVIPKRKSIVFVLKPAKIGWTQL